MVCQRERGGDTFKPMTILNCEDAIWCQKGKCHFVIKWNGNNPKYFQLSTLFFNSTFLFLLEIIRFLKEENAREFV